MWHSLILSLILALQSSPPGTGTEAPAFALKDMRGHTVRLSDYKGNIVVINFWATWCAPCLAEMPDLAKLQNDYQSKGLRVIGLTYGKERKDRVLEIARRLKIKYPMIIGTNAIAAQYGVGDVLPVTIVVDRNGIIRDCILGILEPNEIEKIEAMTN